MLPLDAVYNQDCIAGMKSLGKGTVDLAFADPPFNIGYDYDVYEDELDGEKYLDWCRQWTAQVVRVLKPDGTFWLAIGDEYAAELKVMLQREHGLSCRSWVVWYYTFGVNCKMKFSRSHAHLFHMVKDRESSPSTPRRFASPRRGNWSMATAGRTPPAACPTTPGSCAPRTCPRGFGPQERHLVLSPRVRDVQGAGGLARLPDAGAIAGADHPRRAATKASWCSIPSPAAARRWQWPRSSAAASWALSFPSNMPSRSRSGSRRSAGRSPGQRRSHC